MKSTALIALFAVTGTVAAACSTSTDGSPNTDAGTSLETGSPTEDAGLEDAEGSEDAPSSSDASIDAMNDTAPPANHSTTALLFDGTNDQVVISGGANEAAFTAELWFKGTKATGMMLEVYGSGADRSLYLVDGKVCFYVYTPAYSAICTAANKNDGAWHHVAGTLGSVMGQRLYIDGVEEASAPTVKASAFAADTGIRLGYGYIGPYGANVYFGGTLDEVRVWSVERTAAEVSADRMAAVGPTAKGLDAYWKLDETGSASIAADAKGTRAGMLTGFDFTTSPWTSPGAF